MGRSARPPKRPCSKPPISGSPPPSKVWPVDHVRTVYGSALDAGLENVFNNLDAARVFHATFNIKKGRILEEPNRLIDAPRVVLPALLGETISQHCAFHEALAVRLRVGDAVISLNYDCVVDRALAEHAGFRFDVERGGYGVPVSSGADLWRRSGRGKRPQGSILLLKLHGSLNWRAGTTPLRLRGDPYREVAAGVIAPPLTNKPVETEPFRSIWREARRAVGRMRRLIIIGYSMPDADGLVRTLLTTDLSPHLEDIFIVDPRDAVREKHSGLFTRIAPEARVFPFRTWRQFAQVLP
jgi:SIR2-like domain